MKETGAALGVVIPTLDEEDRLPALLRDLDALDLPLRVVVADGGSTDRTADVARRMGVRVVTARAGRARQLNAGAWALPDVSWTLFLHADSRLPRSAGPVLARWLREASPGTAGYFRFRLEGDGPTRRLIEAGQRVRERFWRLPYGDQGLLVSRERFRAVGGYPDLPIMEDVAMLDRLRGSGTLLRLDVELRTSARLYERVGFARTWIRNALLIALYRAGVSPEALARRYGPRTGGRDRAPHGDGRGNGAPRRHTSRLLVFARAPVPGTVKTRLARDVGDREAARLYRTMGRRIVDQVRRGPYRTEIHFTPPGARRAVEAWLDPGGLDFVPQPEGDLGHRLEEAFARAFRSGAERVGVIGTDAPGLSREHVTEAFRGLERSDVVLGPAVDGGYYLLATRRPLPGLFREIPWSTGEVLEVTLRRAEAEGLAVHLLPVLRDVDTLRDLRALGLAPPDREASEPGCRRAS